MANIANLSLDLDVVVGVERDGRLETWVGAVVHRTPLTLTLRPWGWTRGDLLELCATDITRLTTVIARDVRDDDRQGVARAQAKLQPATPPVSQAAPEKSSETPQRAAKPKRKRERRTWEWRGQQMGVTELARTAGIDVTTLSHRLDAGWALERAMTTKPPRKKNHGST